MDDWEPKRLRNLNGQTLEINADYALFIARMPNQFWSGQLLTGRNRKIALKHILSDMRTTQKAIEGITRHAIKYLQNHTARYKAAADQLKARYQSGIEISDWDFRKFRGEQGYMLKINDNFQLFITQKSPYAWAYQLLADQNRKIETHGNIPADAPAQIVMGIAVQNGINYLSKEAAKARGADRILKRNSKLISY